MVVLRTLKTKNLEIEIFNISAILNYRLTTNFNLLETNKGYHSKLKQQKLVRIEALRIFDDDHKSIENSYLTFIL